MRRTALSVSDESRQPMQQVEHELRILSCLRCIHSHRDMLSALDLGGEHCRFAEDRDATSAQSKRGTLEKTIAANLRRGIRKLP